ncbi:tRNA dihydrouridine(20/20a) synthase DusA [cf. Phormidesmis sp. LEGE 11477]|uniref:tRNA dihydrouridine(20/20a) synthase DusA n=1 Tax=cf. Phormidesmis sp. LEGE 11477 TaxID=1828680 RepID=UPI001D135F43|nr:tRNA dihydrouridine(20/20a) synthase DusA [cf. Phormidesmis sp. LEGE 11477]
MLPLSIAPMMDRTDRHYRFFMRQITRRTLLYTEMINAQAIYHGDLDRLIGFTPDEKPLVLQVGGDDPTLLANCARRAAEFGYSEINLNVGCPSDRVQSGNFGACLMAQPQRVADCVATMMAASPLPVSVKHRIGIDDLDSYEDMANFVTVVASTGCRRFSVHARKAWLQGLSPKDNRNIPPLRYVDVHRLKQDFPQLQIEINGGFKTLEQAKTQLQAVDAVMIGRAAYDTPFLFEKADQEIFGEVAKPQTRYQVVESMLPYIDYHTHHRGARLHSITRHMLHLFHAQPGSRIWKQTLTQQAHKGSGAAVVADALAKVRDAAELARYHQQMAIDSSVALIQTLI